MTSRPPSVLRSRNAILTAVGVALIAGTVVAQVQPMEPIQWDKRRLDQLDRNVRRLERAVTQRNAAGQPVLVEPDPEVIAMQGRLSIADQRLQDVEATMRRMNGEIERMTFQIDESQRDNAALRRRVVDAEGRIEKMERAAREEAELNAPVVAHSPTGDAAQDLTAAARLVGTDPRHGRRALEAVVVTWPDTPQAREANYRLGDLNTAENDAAAAVAAYASALNGWPRTAWAAEATLKLAAALHATDRAPQACAALAEFGRRYNEGATPALRTRATQLRTRAACS